MNREELNKKYENKEISKSEWHTEKGKLNDGLDQKVSSLIAVVERLTEMVDENRLKTWKLETNHLAHMQDDIDNLKKMITKNAR